MRLPHLSLLLLAFLGSSQGDLAPPERSYKILMLLPASSKSHRNVFMPLAEALADRGHQIVMLTNHNKPSKHPNIREINHGLDDFNTDNMNMFEERKKPAGAFQLFKTALPSLARKLYQLPEVKELFEKRKEFDLIVINHMFNEIIYPFAHEMPFITVATPGMDFRQSAVLGNPLSPAYAPGFHGAQGLDTLFGRLKNLFGHVFMAFYWRIWAIIPLVQEEIDKHFPDFPPLLEIERNQSLTLMNSHFSMDTTYPLLPSQKEVGAMHCRPAKPLPEDLQSWIEGAGKAGVVYFSLGSVARGDTMPVEYRNMFIEAFKRLEQRVLWKFESDLEGVSDNVKISKWLPQQDILAQPNVKVFITHGGLLSSQEASYHGTPLLALPIFGDQPKTGEKIVNDGLGLSLVWEELTVELLVDSLQEIINNPKYRENAAMVSKLSQDQPEHPVDRAVFWTEYVIRHQGAPKLRSPAASLSWVELLLLDAAALVLLTVVVVLLLISWLFKKILRAIFGSAEKHKRKTE
ncbi:UDP-glycosyltransferase UGT5-like [Macrobrachium nipponense]|uniref:UDP-glycosyltransferase UGT5-like n=1 Tax=Macrobrachium nipponense TaxID=159736 RepID=UPI0030C818A0